MCVGWGVSLCRLLQVSALDADIKANFGPCMLPLKAINPASLMSPLLEVSVFPARHLQDDVRGKHKALLCFQLLEIMSD